MNEQVPTSTSAVSQPKTSMPRPRVRLDRRKLLRGSAGAAPVLLTLASNPVSAAGGCVVASSWVSGATFKSRNPGVTTVSCGARTVQGWSSFAATNPTLACITQLISASAFGGTACTYNTRSVGWVLAQPVATSGELGVLQHLVALNLCLTQNSMRGTPNGLSSSYLASVWTNYKGTGGYRVPGIRWTEAQLVTWLRYQLAYSLTV